MKPASTLRIALLADELAGENSTAGGLGAYLRRFSEHLSEHLGAQVSLFICDGSPPGTHRTGSVTCHYVPPRLPPWLSVLNRATGRYFTSPWGGAHRYLYTGLALSAALEREHARSPFDVVQSSNCAASGLFVRRQPGRIHVVRLSSDRQLWWETDEVPLNAQRRVLVALEARCRARADRVYAPSRCLAGFVNGRSPLGVATHYPPMSSVPITDGPPPTVPLPPRFLIHFGQIGRRKGSHLLAEAVCRLMGEIPDFRMVWAGTEVIPGDFERLRALHGAPFADSVHFIGPLRRIELSRVLERAEAAVLPSLVDNLPNTAIECLQLGIPVVTIPDSSVDEIVTHGETGLVSQFRSAQSLAETIGGLWRRRFVLPGRAARMCAFDRHADRIDANRLPASFLPNHDSRKALA